MVKMKLRGSTESHTVQAMPIVALGHVNGDVREICAFCQPMHMYLSTRQRKFGDTHCDTARHWHVFFLSCYRTLCPSHPQSVTCQSSFAPSPLVGSWRVYHKRDKHERRVVLRLSRQQLAWFTLTQWVLQYLLLIAHQIFIETHAILMQNVRWIE